MGGLNTFLHIFHEANSLPLIWYLKWRMAAGKWPDGRNDMLRGEQFVKPILKPVLISWHFEPPIDASDDGGGDDDDDENDSHFVPARLLLLLPYS